MGQHCGSNLTGKNVVSYQEQLQRIVNRYIDANQPWPASARDVAEWAIHTGLWAPQPVDLINQCADQLSRAMREEYIRDPQGRLVRAKHAAKIEVDGKQMTLWADIRNARPDHMQTAFQQRRQQIIGDCKQLKADVDSYNENAKPPEPIQLVLDFTLDVEEAEAAARYGSHKSESYTISQSWN